MIHWWGEPWPSAEFPAPICSDPDKRVPIPISESCYLCEEPITEEDAGTSMQTVGIKEDFRGHLTRLGAQPPRMRVA